MSSITAFPSSFEGRTNARSSRQSYRKLSAFSMFSLSKHYFLYVKYALSDSLYRQLKSRVITVVEISIRNMDYIIDT